jgi:hypothetical protein
MLEGALGRDVSGSVAGEQAARQDAIIPKMNNLNISGVFIGLHLSL